MKLVDFLLSETEFALDFGAAAVGLVSTIVAVLEALPISSVLFVAIMTVATIVSFLLVGCLVNFNF